MSQSPAYSGIFGDNNIIEISDAYFDKRILGDSVGMLVDKKDFSKDLKKDLNTNSLIFESWGYFNGRQSIVEQYYIDRSEKFSEQSSIGFCTVFLISDTEVATATHCTREKDFSSKSLIVFGYNTNDFIPKALIYKFPKMNVHQIKSVRKLTTGDDGISILTLSEAVNGKDPLSISQKPLEFGVKLFSIHHPLGLPLKFSDDANVNVFKKMKKVSGQIFTHNLDVMSGSSGAPIFSEDTNQVVGVILGSRSSSLKRKSLFSKNRKYRVHKKQRWNNYSVGIEFPKMLENH